MAYKSSQRFHYHPLKIVETVDRCFRTLTRGDSSAGFSILTVCWLIYGACVDIFVLAARMYALSYRK
ncbi:hypothetical protein V6N13_142809 [Hibiscus sabdariffa]